MKSLLVPDRAAVWSVGLCSGCLLKETRLDLIKKNNSALGNMAGVTGFQVLTLVFASLALFGGLLERSPGDSAAKNEIVAFAGGLCLLAAPILPFVGLWMVRAYNRRRARLAALVTPDQLGQKEIATAFSSLGDQILNSSVSAVQLTDTSNAGFALPAVKSFAEHPEHVRKQLVGYSLDTHKHLILAIKQDATDLPKAFGGDWRALVSEAAGTSQIVQLRRPDEAEPELKDSRPRIKALAAANCVLVLTVGAISATYLVRAKDSAPESQVTGGSTTSQQISIGALSFIVPPAWKPVQGRDLDKVKRDLTQGAGAMMGQYGRDTGRSLDGITVESVRAFRIRSNAGLCVAFTTKVPESSDYYSGVLEDNKSKLDWGIQNQMFDSIVENKMVEIAGKTAVKSVAKIHNGGQFTTIAYWSPDARSSTTQLLVFETTATPGLAKEIDDLMASISIQ